MLLLFTLIPNCCCLLSTAAAAAAAKLHPNKTFVLSVLFIHPPLYQNHWEKNHGPLHIRFYNINQFSFKAHCLFLKPYFKVLARELKIPFYLLLSHVCTRFHFDVPYSQYIRLQQNVEEGDSRLEQKGVWEVDEIFIIRFLS